MTKVSMGRIGGHRGMDVERLAMAGGRTYISKKPLHDIGTQGDLLGVDLYELNVSAIHNEAFALCEMEASGYTPTFVAVENDILYEEDLGDGGIPLDAEVWRQNCVRMLASIRSRGLRHGDLRGNNIITRGAHKGERGNDPYAIDWQEAHYLGDVPPQKSPFSDSMFLMQHIIGTVGPTGVADVPRVARRWGAILGVMGAATNLELPLKGKLFLDLGCFQGDFCALAASEGMHAHGIDQGGFRTGENSIEIANRLWGEFPFGAVTFSQRNILDWDGFAAHVVVMFSTWSYIVKDFGHHRAVNLLATIIQQAGTFFFENQLFGDGPGPEFLRTDEDIQIMLLGAGARTVKAIGTFPVTGRPASRTVWMVQA